MAKKATPAQPAAPSAAPKAGKPSALLDTRVPYCPVLLCTATLNGA